MEARWGVLCLLATIFWGQFIQALPTTLLEDAQAAEARIDTNKVKRAHSIEQLQSATNSGNQFYGSLSAAKRGSNLNTQHTETDVEPSEWEQEKPMFDNERRTEILEKQLFTENSPFDDKTINEYQKGFHYGSNKAKLDEQMENAILKSEMYGEPASINQYRYYGGSDDRRRKRSNVKRSSNLRFTNRFKREVELSPEDILTLLSLWEEDRLRSPVSYPTSWSRFNPETDLDTDSDENDIENDDDSWLESAVYPSARNTFHLSQYPGRISPYANIYESKPYEPSHMLKRQWGDYGDKKRKRFMVSKKRNDPTRELRYLNGPAQGRDDMYSLTQLLGSPRESNYYRRMVL